MTSVAIPHTVVGDHEDVVNVQLGRAYRREWHETLPELLEGDRQIGIWQLIDALAATTEDR